MAIEKSAMESLTENQRLIRLSKSCIGNAEKQAVLGVLDREFLGMGAEVKEFEERLSEFFGRPVVCVANGTAALHLALQAADIGKDDEVLVQSLTYVASFQAISAVGATPVACDVNEDSFTLDLKDAEKRITPNTKAVMPIHYGGGVGNLDEIYAFAIKHSLRVIEDAAHAFGTKYHGNRVGGFGDIACFSFDGIKNITSGEGGCVVAKDIEVLERVQDLRLLGVEKDTAMRYSNHRSWEFDVSEQGWRLHMSNIMAAIGIEQLKNFPKIEKKRKLLASYYDDLLKGHEVIQTLPNDYSVVVPHIYVVRILGMKNRNLIMGQLLKLGIQTGVHYKPNHTLSLYKEKTSLPLKCTDSLSEELLTLPLHPDLTLDDIEYVIKMLTRVCIL